MAYSLKLLSFLPDGLEWTSSSSSPVLRLISPKISLMSSSDFPSKEPGDHDQPCLPALRTKVFFLPLVSGYTSASTIAHSARWLEQRKSGVVSQLAQSFASSNSGSHAIFPASCRQRNGRTLGYNQADGIMQDLDNGICLALQLAGEDLGPKGTSSQPCTIIVGQDFMYGISQVIGPRRAE